MPSHAHTRTAVFERASFTRIRTWQANQNRMHQSHTSRSHFISPQHASSTILEHTITITDSATHKRSFGPYTRTYEPYQRLSRLRSKISQHGSSFRGGDGDGVGSVTSGMVYQAGFFLSVASNGIASQTCEFSESVIIDRKCIALIALIF